ncbi:MAG: hypothetical protein LBS71_02680 [Puniceicoccales bacterium]|jgi:hypothetical protein|nr:hypothetical protein [Puniceicoccales bacterium]
MEEKQKLHPIQLEVGNFFLIIAGLLWFSVFITLLLRGCSNDPIMNICIINNMMYAGLIILLLLLRHIQNWPTINPSKMDWVNSLLIGFAGEIQFILMTSIVVFLEKKLFELLHFDSNEQSIIALLRSEWSICGNLWGFCFE